MDKNENTIHHDDLTPFEAHALELLYEIREDVKALRRQHQLLTIGDVAEMLQVSIRTVDTYAASGEIPPPVRIGGSKRWEREAILSYIRSRASGGHH